MVVAQLEIIQTSAILSPNMEVLNSGQMLAQQYWGSIMSPFLKSCLVVVLLMLGVLIFWKIWKYLAHSLLVKALRKWEWYTSSLEWLISTFLGEILRLRYRIFRSIYNWRSLTTLTSSCAVLCLKSCNWITNDDDFIKAFMFCYIVWIMCGCSLIRDTQ